MKTYAGMEVVMVAGIVLLIAIQCIPALAQVAPAPASFCWDRIMTCQKGAMSQAEFQKVCCPVITQIVSFESPCFCSIKSVTNASEVSQLDIVLGVCNVKGSVDGICTGVTPSPFGAPSPPAPSQPAPSPDSNPIPSGVPPAISPASNLSPSGTPPAALSPSGTPPSQSLSPSPSVTPPATSISPNPSGTPPVASISPSGTPPVALTPGQAPSLTPSISPTMPPLGDQPSAPPTLVEPPLGSTETPTALGPTPPPVGTTEENPPQGAANKITMAESLSIVLVLLAYVFTQ